MRLPTLPRLERISARLAWPGPTHFDQLRDELFALLTTAAVIGVVVHSFWCEFAAE
jgi:hypothetical protein